MIAKLVPLIVCSLIVLIYALFIFKLHQTLNIISIENRKIVPGLVWLVFIPFLGLIWQFIVIVKTASSLKLEFAKHNITANDNFGFGIGITYAVLICLSILPILGGLMFLASTVCWIIYWVRLTRYKKLLESGMFLSQIDSIK